MIEQEALENPAIVRWSNDGQVFFVDDDDKFVLKILPKYGFKARKMQSFQRNLNIYGFSRPVKGPTASGYVHPDFGRDASTDQLELIQRDMGEQTNPMTKDVQNKYNCDHDYPLPPSLYIYISIYLSIYLSFYLSLPPSLPPSLIH